jgi:hypothetical protein
MTPDNRKNSNTDLTQRKPLSNTIEFNAAGKPGLLSNLSRHAFTKKTPAAIFS